MTREEQLRMKHLDYVSAVIGRMSQSSFAIRGWSVTLVTVVFASWFVRRSVGGVR